MLAKLLIKIAGWKRIIAYILLNLPFVTEHPMLSDAINKTLEDPSNPTSWITLIVNLLMVIGVLDGIKKNLE